MISTSSLRVQDLRCDYLLNPLGIESKEPRLSWQLASDQRGATQSAYQIQVKDHQGCYGTRERCSPINRCISSTVDRRCTWQVRVWDSKDRPSAWSELGWWEMGLLHAADWQAQWIEPGWDEDPAAFNPCPYLRAFFTLHARPVCARLYVTAHGLYEASLNGQRVGDAYFTAGYSNYHHRLLYQTYDVSDLLRDGENGAGVILGDGWYLGSLGIASQCPRIAQ